MPRSTTKIYVIEWYDPDAEFWLPQSIYLKSEEAKTAKGWYEKDCDNSYSYRIRAAKFIPAPKRKAKKK